MQKRGGILLLSILILAYLLPVCLAFASCGNTVIDQFEQCDDGNSVDGDGCSRICQLEGENFRVLVYESNNPPPMPATDDLPHLSQITKDGITWTFSQSVPVGRFVNGDYYVVGSVTVTNIDPLPTTSNGRHGSMINILPNIQKSGWDSRITAGRYDAILRVYPPITITPGNKLLSSRSAQTNLPCVMRPNDDSTSPVASISILTVVSEPQPLDAFRPSYTKDITTIYLARNLRRDILPNLAPVAHTAPLSEFEDYLRRPWVDSVFFNFDVPAEYMASYGRENGYLISFAGLLLTVNFTQAEKEPLLVYLTQYGIDLYGLVQAGHAGWNAHGGHGTGRKFPIVLAGVMLDDAGMKSPNAKFGEDMQTIWVNQTLPAGTYSQTWHANPQVVAYGGHYGVSGESTNVGWGPYEHLQPSQWPMYQGSYLGENYRRCCTSVSWVGEALASRLIPGMQAAWNHPQFFAYVDRWMMTPDDPVDLTRLENEIGYQVDTDFMQGQSWKILSGGLYYLPHRTFVDEMWASYRNLTLVSCSTSGGTCCSSGQSCQGSVVSGSDCSVCCVGTCIQYLESDTDRDGCIENFEISEFISTWRQGTVTMPKMMEALKAWKVGC
jgi:cysteine-rich repeat protein